MLFYPACYTNQAQVKSVTKYIIILIFMTSTWLNASFHSCGIYLIIMLSFPKHVNGFCLSFQSKFVLGIVSSQFPLKIIFIMYQEMTTFGARRKDGNFLILLLHKNIRYNVFNNFFLVFNLIVV